MGEFLRQVLGQPGLATDARFDTNFKRNEQRAGIVALIEKVFSTLTAGQIVAKLDAAGIANARVMRPWPTRNAMSHSYAAPSSASASPLRGSPSITD